MLKSFVKLFGSDQQAPPASVAPVHIDYGSSYTHLFISLERAKLSLLQVNQQINQQKRMYFDEGVSSTLSERSVLWAQRDVLEISVQALKIEAIEAKNTAREMKGRSFFDLLVKKVQVAGLENLIEEAQVESLKAVDAAGLGGAFRSKVLV